MNSKNKRLCIRVLSILAVTASIIYAGNNIMSPDKTSKGNYSQMTMLDLQVEVEQLANNDELPFEMGLELMKRWQTEEPKVH